MPLSEHLRPVRGPFMPGSVTLRPSKDCPGDYVVIHLDHMPPRHYYFWFLIGDDAEKDQNWKQHATSFCCEGGDACVTKTLILPLWGQVKLNGFTRFTVSMGRVALFPSTTADANGVMTVTCDS